MIRLRFIGLIFVVFAMTVTLGCVEQSLDLVEDDHSAQPGTGDHGKNDVAIKANNTLENSVRPADDRADQTLVSGTRNVFRDLSIAPSYHWENAEFRLFTNLHRMMLVWDQASYRSLEENEIAAFFHLMLQALLTDEDSKSGIFRDIRAYALPIFLKKEIPARHRPVFSLADLEKEALALFNRGFNLNQVRLPDLRNFLKHLGEVGWRDHPFVPDDPWATLTTAMRDESTQMDRDDLQAFRRCAMQLPRKDRPSPGCELDRYRLQWTPSVGRQPSLELLVRLDSGRSRDLFQDMLAAYQKKPGWFGAAVMLPQIPLTDEYIMAATGPDALTFGSDVPPGNPEWPQNLRQTDWENFAPLLLEATVSPELKMDMDTCGTSILDSLAIFSRFAQEVRGKPGEGSTSTRLFAPLADGEVLARTWTLLWFLHASASEHHSALGIKSGCENHVLKFLAVRTLWLLASQKGNPDLETASMMLVFRTLLSLRTPVRPAVAVAPATAGAEPKPDVSPTVGSLCDPKDFPELASRDQLLPRMEAAWVLLGQTESFLNAITAKPLADVPLIQAQTLKNVRAGMEKLAVRRTYLPALLRLNPERVSYRRAKDALDYYLLLTQEARRAIKAR